MPHVAIERQPFGIEIGSDLTDMLEFTEPRTPPDLGLRESLEFLDVLGAAPPLPLDEEDVFPLPRA